MPQVSVIIPNRNNAKYIAAAISSVRKQTFKNLEIILVDDKSDDDSLKIAKKAAGKDRRVKIISIKKNEGVGAARNRGMKAARGEFVMFLDSDDVLNPTAVRGMLVIAAATGADIVSGGYARVPEHFYIPKNAFFPPPAFDFKSVERDEFVWSMPGFSNVVVWGKLIRRTILGGCSFRVDIYPYEDVEFMLRLYARADICVITPNVATYYRKSRTSVILDKGRDVSRDVAKVLTSLADFVKTKENGGDKYTGFVGYYSLVLTRIYITDALRALGAGASEKKLRARRRKMRGVARAVRKCGDLFRRADMTPKHRVALYLFGLGFVESAGAMLLKND